MCFLSTGVQHELELQHIDWGLGAVSSSRKNSGMKRGRRARHAAENAPLSRPDFVPFQRCLLRCVFDGASGL